MDCSNIKRGFCNENVHNIIKGMGGGKLKKSYEGVPGLFGDSSYPIFEEDKCIQYLQQFVPFHLSQIEYALSAVMKKTEGLFGNTVNILDLGSGPATVALSFCRLLPKNQDKRKLQITTVEASKTFNSMIDVFKTTNTNDSVKIVDKLEYNIHNDDCVLKTGYNWVIMANAISAIGENRSKEKVNEVLNGHISKTLHSNDKILLTIIEGSSTKYFNIPEYLDSMDEIGFKDLKIVKEVHSIKEYWLKAKMREIRYRIRKRIRDCEYHAGEYDLPYINSKSLLLALK